MFDHVDPHYDVAQICRRGHVVNGATQECPEHNRDFCPTCGAKTIKACERCDAPIQGQFHGFHGGDVFMDEPPAYCHACGKPYPWTAEGIEAARAIADELDGLTEPDKIAIKASIEDLVIDSPRTPVAILRFKKLFATATGATTKELLKDLLAKIVVESAKGPLGF